jgi:hypothetical protein
MRASVDTNQTFYDFYRTCLGTANATLDYWTDTSVNNNARSWFWIVYVLLLLPQRHDALVCQSPAHPLFFFFSLFRSLLLS